MVDKQIQEINTKDLTKLIVESIQEEPYFTKEVLIPKIKTLITSFRLKLLSNQYNQIETPNKLVQAIRANELHNLEKDFWKESFKAIIGEEKIKEYYKELDNKRIEWGYK